MDNVESFITLTLFNLSLVIIQTCLKSQIFKTYEHTNLYFKVYILLLTTIISVNFIHHFLAKNKVDANMLFDTMKLFKFSDSCFQY